MTTGDVADVVRAEAADGSARSGVERTRTLTIERSADARATVTVDVVLDSDPTCRSAALIGDFTAWAPIEMDDQGDGAFRLRLRLAPGRTYAYRLLINDEWWDCDVQDDPVASGRCVRAPARTNRYRPRH